MKSIKIFLVLVLFLQTSQSFAAGQEEPLVVPTCQVPAGSVLNFSSAIEQGFSKILLLCENENFVFGANVVLEADGLELTIEGQNIDFGSNAVIYGLSKDRYTDPNGSGVTPDEDFPPAAPPAVSFNPEADRNQMVTGGNEDRGLNASNGVNGTIVGKLGPVGANAPTLIINASGELKGNLSVIYPGQKGGTGSKGAPSGNGGNGQRGRNGKGNKHFNICDNGADYGGNAGAPGVPALGGKGGKGGQGGLVIIDAQSLGANFYADINVEPGPGGNGGPSGDLGKLGRPGLGGNGGPIAGCKDESLTRKGQEAKLPAYEKQGPAGETGEYGEIAFTLNGEPQLVEDGIIKGQAPSLMMFKKN